MQSTGIVRRVDGLGRFVLPIELRREEKEGADRAAAFEKAKARLKEYLKSQGISRVTVTLSDLPPRQHPDSGKFRHVMNMQAGAP